MKNIQLFDQYTGLIFTELLNEFPLKHWIEVSKFTRKQIDEDTLSQPYENQIFIGTIEWLGEEGYIKVQSLNQYGANCILTSKALALLKSKPKNISEQSKSYGELLKEYASRASEQAFSVIVNSILARMV